MKKAIIILVSFLASCTPNTIPTAKNKIDYNAVPNRSCKQIRYTTIPQFDTLYMNAEQSSMEGSFFIRKDSLYFADKILSNLQIYDKNGKYITSKLSQGRGPNELLGLNQVTCNPGNQELAIMDEQWFVYLLDSNLNIDSKFMLRFQPVAGIKKSVDHPDPNDPGIYEVEYGKNKLRMYDKNYLFFPIVTEHVNFNAYGGINTPYYYAESFNLAKLSLESGEIEKMLCNFPPVYRKYKYATNFKYLLFDINGDDLIFSFEIDSLVYRMNLIDSTIFSFGNAGKDMDTRYPEYKNLEDSDNHTQECRENYGYYRDLSWIPETRILFRTYRKGKHPQKDGLQVYKDNNLIADIDVPRSFEIIGYSAPWYYATEIPDYDNEKFIIYRFKI